MYTKWSFFPFDVLQKFFLCIFKALDPKNRDPRPRLPYNGHIICALFEKKFSDPFNFAIFSKNFTFLAHLVGAPIAARERISKGVSYMLRYLPMQFSQTRYREPVEHFPFQRGLGANMAIKDRNEIFRTRKPYNFLLECPIKAIISSTIGLSWVRILILK